MAKKRKLSDLYVRGKELSFDDGDGSVTIYLKKLNPVETETALRRAGAARARVLAATREGSDEHEIALAEALELDDDGVLDALVSDELLKRAPVIEAELGAEEEWSKDNYLQGLRDAWEDLRWKYAEDSEDEEASRVLEELKRFNDTFDERLEGERERIRRDLATKDMEVLRLKLVNKYVQNRADQAWLSEYRRTCLFFAVRENDAHKSPYFETRDEVDELPIEVLGPLLRAYEELSVDVIEGKGSGETPGSSPPSDSPAPEEISVSSGQPAAVA